MRKLFLGVDGGGTKTKVSIIDDQKKLLTTTETEGSNYQVIGIHKALANIKEAIRSSLADLNLPIFRAYFCLSGVNFESDEKKWQHVISDEAYFKSLFIYPPVVVNDTQAALRAGTDEKNALVIISGTGSNCYGRNIDGMEAKSGGADYILSDQGSGYFIGSEFLKAITKHLDGRGDETILTETFFKKFNINSLEELSDLVYHQKWHKIEIAHLAPIVEEVALKRDKIALEIVSHASFELGLMVKVVASKLNLTTNEFTLVLSGSVLTSDGLVASHLKDYVKSFAPLVKFTKPNIDPSVAAAYLAIEHINN